MTIAITTLRVTFHTPDGAIPAEGRPGMTLMELAREAGVPGIIAECGGACVCATCHLHIAPDWRAAVGPASEMEAEVLEFAEGFGEGSRLSCQIRLAPELDGLDAWVAA